MYCSKCGKMNDDDAHFCIFCGEEMVDDQPESVTMLQFLKNRVMVFLKIGYKEGSRQVTALSRRHKKIVPLVIVAVVLLLIVGVGLRMFINPERVAIRFFKDYMAGNWEEVYENLNLPPAETMDKDHFLRVAQSWRSEEYLDYQVEEEKGYQDELFLRYRFTYSTSSSTSSSTKIITLAKSGKWLGIFDRYRVTLDELVAENCSVALPTGATLLVDGEIIEATADGDGLYVLPPLFAGEHILEASHPAYMCSPVSVELSNNAMVNLQRDCSVNLSSLANTEYGDIIAYMTAVFRSAIAGESLESTGVPISSLPNSTFAADFYQFQTNCQNRIGDRGPFELQSCTLTSAQINEQNGQVECRLDYECLSYGTSDNSSDSFTGSVTLNLSLENSVWELVSLQISNIW